MAKKQNKNTMQINRKITLIPVASDNDGWKKKMNTYLEKFYFDKKIKAKERQIKNTSKPERKEEYKQQLTEYKKQQEQFLNGELEDYTKQMVMSYTYDLVRDCMESEARQKNFIMSYMFSEMIREKVCYLKNKKEKEKWVNDNINVAFRVKGSPKGSIFDDVEIYSPLRALSIQGYTQELKGRVKKFATDGGLDGKLAVDNYKLDSPFHMSKQGFDIVHEYEDLTELKKNIGKSSCEIYVNLGNGGVPTFARFQLDFGHKGNREELISTITKVFIGEYKVCGSSIQINKKNKIILNLGLEIPKRLTELDENTVVGVDLGLAVPAVCSLNNNQYKKEYIGDGEAFVKQRGKIQKEKQRLQKALKLSKGGHGRKRKMLALERFKEREANFVNTYCHRISKKVVEYALKNNAKYINIENLKGYDSSKFILRNWSFYQLQQDITYKAERYGIEVRKINPAFTSQVCSFCGHWESGQRINQKTFKCGNPNCKSHNLKFFNADYNAARNISMSTLFTSDNYKFGKESLQKAADYYGIDLEIDSEDQEIA